MIDTRFAKERLIKNNELPSLPDNWEVERFRFLFSESKERNGETPVGEMLSVSEYSGVVPKVYEHEEQKRTYEELQSYRVVRPGQLAVNSMWLNHLGLGVSEYTGHISPAYAAYNISSRLTKRFVHHLMRSNYYLNIYMRYLYGIRPNSFQIKSDDWLSIPIIIPPKNIQKEIADFLDRETDRVNQLIEKKQKLLVVLQEKQANLINHTIRQGIHPNLTMKRIHIPGIELIPESWEVKKLRHLGSLQNGVSEGAEYFGEGYPFVGYGDVYKHFALPTNVSGLAKSSDTDRERYSVLAGDIFFTRTSEVAEEIGISSVCLETIDNATFSGFLIRFRPNTKALLPNFSKYYFRSDIPRIFFVKEMNLVTRVSLSQGLLKSLPVIIPPIEEQEEISHFLDKKTAQINLLSKNVEHSINQLKEFRISLITEAVTGQLDIKSWKKRGSTDERLDNIEESMRA